MGLIRKLFGRQKTAAYQNQNDDIVSLPAGVSGPLISLVKAIDMKPLPISADRLGRLRKKADKTLQESLQVLEAGFEIEITPSNLASMLLKALGDEAIPHLIKLLGCEDRDVGKIACDTCVSLGLRAVPGLVNAMKEDKIDSRLDATAALLGMVGAGVTPMPKEVIAGLSDLIRQEKLGHWDVIVMAAAALGEIGEDAVSKILELLRDDSYLVRLGAVAGFARMGGKAALSALQQARREETNFTVAEAIDFAIEMIEKE